MDLSIDEMSRSWSRANNFFNFEKTTHYLTEMETKD